MAGEPPCFPALCLIRKPMRHFLILLSAMLLSVSGHASVVINATRVIYPSSSKFVNVQLVNRSTTTHLVQSWIDDGNPAAAPESIKVPFTLTPPVVKMAASEGQTLKITLRKGTPLAKDRETVYWLNVLDIPPVPENASGGDNYLQVAIRSRIKLLYRPDEIPSPASDIHKKLTLESRSGGSCLKNSSPYYVTVPQIIAWSGGDLKKKTDDNLLKATVFVEPFGCQSVPASIKAGSRYRVTWMDDYGSKKFGVIQ